MSCPVCGSKVTGKISSNQHYCWECFVEYNDAQEVFFIEEDGNLVNQGEVQKTKL